MFFENMNAGEILTNVYGLILSGGKSTRMGNDKGLIAYHGKPQREYLYELASQFCDVVYYSARENQLDSFTSKANVIVDRNEYRGPFNGILSAHNKYPEVAWLVLACDLPLLNKQGLSELVEQRNTEKYATAFSAKDSGLPEPLVAIWEPKALIAAKNYLETTKNSSPQKFLIDSDIQLVVSSSKEQLYNANSMEDYQLIQKKLA
ncbi:MAG: NTP transferase domain-containing protein [Bacteroidota bacterium]